LQISANLLFGTYTSPGRTGYLWVIYCHGGLCIVLFRPGFLHIFRQGLDEWIYFLKNEEIKEDFTAKGLKEAKEKLGIMKLPEDEQKAYEHYKDDLHYQASMFESSFGDGYNEGKAEGKAEGIVEGINQTTKNIALNLVRKGTTIEIIAEVTGLSEADINQILQKASEQ